MSSRLAAVTKGNVALLGDASGTVDAITGEGLHLAFRQAAALAEALAAGDLSPYAAAHRRLQKMPQLMARLLLLLGWKRAHAEGGVQNACGGPVPFQRHAGLSRWRPPAFQLLPPAA